LLRKYPTSYTSNKIKTNIKNILKWGAIGGITIFIIQFPYAIILGRKEIKAALFIPASEDITFIIILLVLSVTITPIIEELFFRLCVYRILKNRFNKTVGYIGTALLFSVMHTASFFQACLFTTSSIILTYIYEKTGLIETSMLAHSFWNIAWFSSVYIYHISSTF
jgi:membrane protease YdiL (CAAX protease family)